MKNLRLLLIVLFCIALVSTVTAENGRKFGTDNIRSSSSNNWNFTRNSNPTNSRAVNIPNLVDFQGRLNDSLGNPLTSTESILFSLYDTDSGGVALWSETQSVDVVDGLFHVTFGSVNPLSETDFSGPDRWVGVTVGTDPEMTPLIRVGAVPYALQSAPDNDWTIDGNNQYSAVSGNVGIGTTATHTDTKLSVEGNIKVHSGDTPRLLLSQSDGGYAPYEWAVGGNESNFYLRDVDAGNKLPFRIKPGSNNSRLLIHDNGVGINLTTSSNNFPAPSQALDVNGQIRMRTDATDGFIPVSDADGVMTWTDPASISFIGDNLGDHTAAQNLDMANNDITNGGTVTANSFVGNGSGLTNISHDNLGNHTATQNVKLNGNWLSNDGDDEGLFVDANGNVGSGLMDPSHELEVGGDFGIRANNPLMTFSDLDGTNGNRFSSIRTTMPSALGTDGSSNQKMQFYVSNGGTGQSNVMTLQGNGSMGIGTTTPQTRFEIEDEVPSLPYQLIFPNSRPVVPPEFDLLSVSRISGTSSSISNLV